MLTAEISVWDLLPSGDGAQAVKDQATRLAQLAERLAGLEQEGWQVTLAADGPDRYLRARGHFTDELAAYESAGRHGFAIGEVTVFGQGALVEHDVI